MLNQFLRTELLFGQKNMGIFKNSRVAVFGIGGVGGYTAEALARSGIGELDLIDPDKISITNINRQIFATMKTVGKYKVDVARERLLDINPNMSVNIYKVFYMPDNSGDFDFCRYDYVVDAIDTVTGKLEIIQQAYNAGVPVVSSMGAGNKINPAEFEVADIYQTSVCPLAKVMRRELKKRGIKKLKVVYSKEKPLTPLYKDHYKLNEISSEDEVDYNEIGRTPGSNSFVPPVVGLIIAGEVLKDLAEYV